MVPQTSVGTERRTQNPRTKWVIMTDIHLYWVMEMTADWKKKGTLVTEMLHYELPENEVF